MALLRRASALQCSTFRALRTATLLGSSPSPFAATLTLRGLADGGRTPGLSPVDITTIVDHVTHKRVKLALDNLQRPSLPVGDFLRITARNGLDESTGRKLLRAMADSGNLLYMPDARDEALRSTVLLDTDGVTQSLTKFLATGLEQEVQRDVAKIEEELKPYKEVAEKLERRSRRHADLVSYSGLGLLVTQFGLFFHLTFFELSWDIMEPVSYFVGQATVIAAYSYFLVMKRDHTHEDLWNRARRRRRERLFAGHGLSYQRFRELSAELSRHQQLVAVAGQPSHTN